LFIDGTHVRVNIPRSEAIRYKGKKDWYTQNVFVTCDFNTKFTYVLVRW